MEFHRFGIRKSNTQATREAFDLERTPNPETNFRTLIVAIAFHQTNLRLLEDAISPMGIEVWPLDHPQGSLPEGAIARVVIYETDSQEHWRNALEQIFRRWPGVPLVFISKFADQRMWIDVLKAGAYDLIMSPLQPTELRWVVGCALKPPLPQLRGGARTTDVQAPART